jgi:hypothetical protein
MKLSHVIRQMCRRAYLAEFRRPQLGFSCCTPRCPALEDRILILFPKGAVVICVRLVVVVGQSGAQDGTQKPGITKFGLVESMIRVKG